MDMFRKFLFLLPFLFIFSTSSIFSLTLKEKFEHGGSPDNIIGSYIITENQKNLTFLRFHSYETPFLFLEEISAPSQLIKKEVKQWDQWLINKAPHHTSWILYKIDLNTCKIITCYSFSRECFISLSEENSFLPTLITLPLKKVALSERKKIGPPPTDELQDTRKIWNPIKIFQGEKIKNTTFEVMQATWPKDLSELSNKSIDLYFDEKNPSFPFPYWIEIGDGYNTFKMHVIDSGRSLYFPFKKIPKLTPLIKTFGFSKELGLNFELERASDFQSFQIIATKSSGSSYSSQILPYEEYRKEKSVLLTISMLSLEKFLEKKERYTFTIIPIEDPSLSIESIEPFYFNP